MDFNIYWLFGILLAFSIAPLMGRKCSSKLFGATIHKPDDIEEDELLNELPTTFRVANQDVYLWPSLDEREKSIIRAAFFQISRRTCIRFNELDYKPWYHADRWSENKPYVVIRKSKLFSGYSDNKIEDVNQRSLIYIQESSLHNTLQNNSRGMIMSQLLKFMGKLEFLPQLFFFTGYHEELWRPDAPSYIQPLTPLPPQDQPKVVKFSNEQLQWPFDPESITIPSKTRHTHQLTIYCQTRNNADIGAGQRTGLLTRWDAVKLNSMYCPQQVGYADPRLGPCVVARNKKRINK